MNNARWRWRKQNLILIVGTNGSVSQTYCSSYSETKQTTNSVHQHSVLVSPVVIWSSFYVWICAFAAPHLSTLFFIVCFDKVYSTFINSEEQVWMKHEKLLTVKGSEMCLLIFYEFIHGHHVCNYRTNLKLDLGLFKLFYIWNLPAYNSSFCHRKLQSWEQLLYIYTHTLPHAHTHSHLFLCPLVLFTAE